MGVLGIGVLAAVPHLGWRPMLLLGMAIVSLVGATRLSIRMRAPEYGMAFSWAFSQVVLGLAVVLTGGIESYVLSWLIIPLMTLPARFIARVVIAGVAFTGLLVVGIALFVEPSQPLPQWYATSGFLSTLFGVTLLSVALMRSDVDHRTEAVIDVLTGMLNRRALEQRLEELRAQAAITGHPVAAIAADIDHFKRINDEHGHARGDAVLVEVAQRLRTRLRAFDLAYRVGGEEFIVLLPGADADEALTLADELRAEVTTVPIGGLAVTMSFGVAATTGGAFAGAELLAEADAALYVAKAHGRDRVIAA